MTRSVQPSVGSDREWEPSGSKINFGVSQGSDLTGNFEGTVNGTAMSGTWSSPAGGVCGADQGTWTAKKIS